MVLLTNNVGYLIANRLAVFERGIEGARGKGFYSGENPFLLVYRGENANKKNGLRIN